MLAAESASPQDFFDQGLLFMASPEGISISERLVIVNSAGFVLTRIINLSVIVWVYQFLLSKIPTDEFAVYPVVAAIMVMAPLFFTSFTGGITRNALDAYAKGDGLAVTRIVSSILPLIGLMTAIFLPLGWLFAINIDHVLNIPVHMVGQASLMMALLVLAFAVQMMLVPFQIGFHIHQKFVEMNMIMLGREVFRLLLLLGLMYGLGAQVMWVVIASFLADTSCAIVLAIRSRALVPELRFRRDLVDRTEARALMSFGLWTSLGQLGNVMYTHAATIVLNLYGTPQDVTVYFIGATIFRQLQGLIQVAIQPLLPAITAMQATHDIDRLRRTMLRGGRYGLWVALLPGAALMVYADEFVRLYAGEAYIGAAVVIVLFMAILPFDRATTLLPTVCIAMAKVREFFLPAFLFQLAGLVLMVVCAGPMGLGAVGVTLALAAITIVSQLGYFWGLALRLGSTPLPVFLRSTIWLGWLPGLVGLGVWFCVQQVWEITTWWRLAASVAIGTVFYVATLLIFCVEPAERLKLRKRLSRLTTFGRKD
jgi:O-antigen/teichoic acid export membrane protein